MHIDLWVCGMIWKFIPAQTSKGCHVSILDQNQNMINLLRLDVFLATAKKSQGLQEDFFDALGQMASVRCAVSALLQTFEGWSYFKETPVPLAGPPHATVQRLP